MIRRLIRAYRSSTLAARIRISYMVILIPFALFMIIYMAGMQRSSHRYDEIIQSAVVAGDFSLDFKEEFDYEAYLLIVGNKSPEESRLDDLLADATAVLDDLEGLTEREDNRERLESTRQFLENLENYRLRILENSGQENMYEDNIRIWENDIQIVTELIKENIAEYLYYEIRELQANRAEYEAFYQQTLGMLWVALFLVLLLITGLAVVIPRGITRPVRELSEVTKEIAGGNLTVRSTLNSGGELGELSDSLNIMIDKINELLEQVTTEQTRLRKAEFELLQSQINPHFLYNTLDTIIWLAEGGDSRAVVSMVGSLSSFFRTSLNQGREIVTLREEMRHVKSYLEIQQVRYQDILSYELAVPETLDEYRIPKISIQPLVENALYHGIKYKREPGMIRISGFETADALCLVVQDDGVGMKPERLEAVTRRLRSDSTEKDGFMRGDSPSSATSSDGMYGLYNVNKRIVLAFGQAYGLSVASTPGEGTTVTLRLPRSVNDRPES